MKIVLLIAMFGVCTLGAVAQVNFQKKASIAGELKLAAYHTLSDELAYLEEYNDNVYTFTIFNDDFSVNRIFSIPNCDKGLAVLNPQAIFDVTDSHLSQNLFNDDEKFEVVRINSSGKMEVVNEDNAILCILPDEFDCTNSYQYDEPYLYTCQLKGKDYIYADNIYLVEKTGSSNFVLEKKTKSLIAPNPIKSTEELTMDLEDYELAPDSYVEIVNMSGVVVEHYSMPVNNRKIGISVRRLLPGQYVYNVISNQNIVNTGRLTIE